MEKRRGEKQTTKGHEEQARAAVAADTVEIAFQGATIRTLMIAGRPWFVAKDVCESLEFSDLTAPMRGLDDDEKSKTKVWTEGGVQELNIVDESGLYSLAFVSRKAEAKKLRKWVTREVLPSLRRGAVGEPQAPTANGAYIYVPWHGEFHVSFKENGDLSIVSDESRIDQFYLLELEALAHASCLVGKLWGKFQLLEEVAAHTGEGSNTRFQLGQAISQIQHIAVSAMRTRMEMPEGSGTPKA